ncbi:hypothetical protein [Nonomuraea candida]|uniref:hypothetical protein n=1 Tax=Nonomuraea candida TaxID=359159 RepID=UPI0005BE0EC7|nr:hypothetical protein [Nonomuraea candida]
MITYRSHACPARWLVVLVALWLGVALWSPCSPAPAAEPVRAASSVHFDEEPSTDEPGPRCPPRSPVKRPRATGGPVCAVLAGGPPAHTVRAAQAVLEEVPTRGDGHTERLVRLSVWRV